jgi:hypothetical protein
MSKATLEKWTEAACALSEVRTAFTPPIRVLLGEAVDLARFTAAYWEPTLDAAKRTLRPGLCQAGPKLSANVGTEIMELQDALQTAHTEYLLTVAPVQEDVRSRAEFVLSEIVAALSWSLDDGVDDDRDRQLQALKEEHSVRSASADAMAAELYDYATLARQELAALEGVGGFDTDLVDEAEMLAKQLRERPTTPTTAANTRAALELRNRVATLLVERMTLVRGAARFVFRNFPAVAKEAGSAFERRRRSARRATGEKKATETTTARAEATNSPV